MIGSLIAAPEQAEGFAQVRVHECRIRLAGDAPREEIGRLGDPSLAETQNSSASRAAG